MIGLNALWEKSLCEQGKRVGIGGFTEQTNTSTGRNLYETSAVLVFSFFVCWDLSLFVKANFLLIAFLTLKLNQMKTESL